jgi:hypothetical protein
MENARLHSTVVQVRLCVEDQVGCVNRRLVKASDCRRARRLDRLEVWGCHRAEPWTMKSTMSAALAFVSGFALSSCTVAVSVAPTQSPFVPVGSVAPIHSLAAPDAFQPAAGICGAPSGDIATVTLNLDTPDPRCLKVLATQRLRLVNATPSSVTFTFDGSDYELEPGAEQTIDKRFGAIWQPGVHFLHTSLYGGGGPDIWLGAG